MNNKKQIILDRNAPTYKARFLWCLQLSFRVNLVTVGDARNILVEKKIIKTKEDNVPKEFDPANLTNLFVDTFVTWDEVHSKVIPGSDYGCVRTPYNDHIMKLPHDNNGKLDVSKSTHSR